MSESCSRTQPSSDIHDILEGNGVPCLFFAWLQIALMVGDYGFIDLDVAVPDGMVDAGRDALVKAGLPPCEDPNCHELKVRRFPGARDEYPSCTERATHGERHLVGAMHFHINHRYPAYYTLTLHKRTHILSHLPDPILGNPAADDRNVMLTTDRRLPKVFDEKPIHWLTKTLSKREPLEWRGSHPVKILTLPALVEALLVNSCKDRYHPEDLSQLWAKMLIYYLPCLDAQIKTQIAPDFQDIWEHRMGRGPQGSTMCEAYNRFDEAFFGESKPPGYSPFVPPPYWAEYKKQQLMYPGHFSRD